jgi:dolichyl-diphosphooligosaccharide--protein glycosyltransferase/undecaprenyl-diphosphooligosaccharide--protein glycosyltransferase
MKDYKFNSVDEFLNKLHSKEFVAPKKSRDIYFYLPFKMLNILPTVDLFQNMNLMTGQRYQNATFYRASPIGNSNGVIKLNNGMEIRNNSLKVGNRVIPINEFVITQYDNKGKLQKNIQHLNVGASLYVIFMKNYNQFLLLDKRLYNSLYIQLFVLENYDAGLFEPTILTPITKVFKLKI